jgi:hypothetical protein
MFLKIEQCTLYDTDFTTDLWWRWNTPSNEEYFDSLLTNVYHEYELRKINPIPALIKMYSIYTETHKENIIHFARFFKKQGLDHYSVLL